MKDAMFLRGDRHLPSPGIRSSVERKLGIRLRAKEVECRKLQVDIQRLEGRLEGLMEVCIQLSGGDLNPHSSKTHPGQLLLSLGWRFLAPDPRSGDDARIFDHELTAAEVWKDPEEKGMGTHSLHCLTGALNIAFRRFLGWSAEGGAESAPKGVTRYERMLEDEDSGE